MKSILVLIAMSLCSLPVFAQSYFSCSFSYSDSRPTQEFLSINNLKSPTNSNRIVNSLYIAFIGATDKSLVVSLRDRETKEFILDMTFEITTESSYFLYNSDEQITGICKRLEPSPKSFDH